MFLFLKEEYYLLLSFSTSISPLSKSFPLKNLKLDWRLLQSAALYPLSVYYGWSFLKTIDYFNTFTLSAEEIAYDILLMVKLMSSFLLFFSFLLITEYITVFLFIFSKPLNLVNIYLYSFLDIIPFADLWITL